MKFIDGISENRVCVGMFVFTLTIDRKCLFLGLNAGVHHFAGRVGFVVEMNLGPIFVSVVYN